MDTHEFAYYMFNVCAWCLFPNLTFDVGVPFSIFFFTFFCFLFAIFIFCASFWMRLAQAHPYTHIYIHIINANHFFAFGAFFFCACFSCENIRHNLKCCTKLYSTVVRNSAQHKKIDYSTSWRKRKKWKNKKKFEVKLYIHSNR